jgi:uncharacterized protein (DUF1800 family)
MALDLEPYAPSPGDPWNVAKAGHLLRRAGFGALPSEVAQAVEAGPDGAVDALFAFPPAPAAPNEFSEIFPVEEEGNAIVLRSILSGKKPLGNPEVRAAYVKAIRAHTRGIAALTAWWMERMATSPAPLQEKLTLFWHGHFTSSFGDVRDAIAMYDQNQLFRGHAAGNFGQLLNRVARDAAMLRYLNNDANRKDRPNENWARELLELFTMGIGHYTETDVKESARAWTGWTLREFRTFAGRRAFAFKPEMHDEGMKIFLGQTGAWDGADVMRLILADRATPRWIAGKLAKFFVAPTPDPGLVGAMAEMLHVTGYEVAPLLRMLFRSRAFYRPAVMRAQIKSPVEFVVGAVRHLGISAPDWVKLSALAAQVGQRLFFPPTVKGWDGGTAWINAATIFNRTNLVGALLSGAFGTPDIVPLSSPETMSARLLQRPLPAARRAILVHAARRNREAAIHLIMSLPEYQVC